jgi:outer membrane protein assembly factor BamA
MWHRLIVFALVVASSPAFADDGPPSETPPTTPPPTQPPPPPPTPPPAERPHGTGVFEIGAGFSPDEGFIATARMAQSNLFHTGQQLSMDASVSRLHERFAVDYGIPNLGNTGLDLRTELLSDRRALPGFEREGVGGSVALERRVDRATRVFVRMRAERVLATPDATTALAETTGGTMLPTGGPETNTIVAAGAGIAYDTRDSPIPLHGTRLELYGERADPSLGSDLALWSASARLDHAESLGPLTLRVSGHAAFVGADGGAGVPMSERLYYMGNSDVRGFGLDPSDRGANALATGRVELEAPVWRRAGLSLAGFYDTGVTYNRDAQFGPLGSTLRRAVGASVIWRSPIGPLRFDLAMPLDGTRDKKFLFWLGTAF